MVVQHNIPAINSHRNLLVNNTATAKNLEKLSSGYRINRAGDDAAGLAISEKMRGQIRGLAKAEENAQNGISLIQTAEGGMQEIHSILQRMRELAVQSANGTYKDEVDRENLNLEFQSLKSEIDRISEYTNYNGIKLLNGELGITLEDDSFTGAFTGLSIGGGTTWGGTNIANWDANSTFDFELSFNGEGKLIGVTGEVVNTHATDGGNWEVDSWAVDSSGVLTITLDNGATLAFNGFDDPVTYTVGTDNKLVRNITISGGNGAATTAPVVNANTDFEIEYVDSDSPLIFQIGANGTADQQVALNVQNMASTVLGMYKLDAASQTPIYDENAESVADQNIATRDHANAAIEVLDNAINMVSTQRAGLGALQNRLEYTLNNLGVTKENLTSAESVIRDVDMAKEMMEFTKNQILVQASQAMLATANQLPQGILNLLR